jgi:hypothetical protein
MITRGCIQEERRDAREYKNPYPHGSYLWARAYWRYLTLSEIKAYMIADIKQGRYPVDITVKEHIIATALQSEYETIHDL